MECSGKSLRGILYLLLILFFAGITEASWSCPSWFEALNRNSTDDHTNERLRVELDGCQVVEYEVYKMVQDVPEGDLADLEPGDIFIEWDEDPCDGYRRDFTFSGTYVDVTDVLPDYVQVSSTNDNIINWKVYKVTASGTLTIDETDYNEHDAIHVEYLLDFEKTDDVSNGDCIGPDDPNGFTYEICWDNTTEITFEDAYIIDYLSAGVDYNYLISVVPYVKDSNYSEEEHTYTWELGDIAPDDSGCVSLTVKVNELAEPGMYLHNVARLWADPNMLVAVATEDTLVCCWADPNIIYVDETATGNNTGLSWENAYSGEEGLQKGLTWASESTCNGGPYTFYVAQGTYSPGNYGSDSFRVPEGSSVYGGFMAGGSILSERNPDRYETVLTGYTFIDDDPNVFTDYELNDTVVTMVNQYVSDPNYPVDETTLLDGFTVAEAVEYGIYGNGVDFTLINCTVTESGLYDGIRAENGDITIKWCKVKKNERYGIYHIGEGNVIAIENSHIVSNKQYGVYCLDSTPTIKNSVVFGNGYFQSGFEGILIYKPSEVPILYNNTIVYNAKAGISLYDDENSEGDPNYPDYPDIRNSILYYNNNGGDQITISLPFIPLEYERDDYTSYCCIEGSIEDHNNINDEPGFVHSIEESRTGNPYQYHLAYDSVCKDRGDPSQDANDLGSYDLDGEDRIVDFRADIGADEIYSCDDDLSEDDIYNVMGMDWDYDGIVNYHEFAEFSDVWLIRDPNDPDIIIDPNYSEDPDHVSPDTLAMWREKWNSFYNLDDTESSEYMIDVDDLKYLANDWAWIACWKQSQLDLSENMMEMMAMGGGESMMMMMPMAISFTSLTEPEPEPEAVERTTAQLVSLVEGIYGIIDYVDSVDQTHENGENLYEIKAFLEGVLRDLQAQR